MQIRQTSTAGRTFTAVGRLVRDQEPPPSAWHWPELAGKLFFQGASSGCTGNGDVSPHPDGRLNLYDVTLTIASCNATHAHLNAACTGLAATTASSYWDYDMLLRMWLSTGDAAAPAAITMLAERL